MSYERRKKRLIDAQGRELYKLTVEYLFHIQNKGSREVKELLKEYNLKWVGKCRTFNRQICTPNPHGFRAYLKNTKVIKSIQKELGLDPPKQNWLQRLFY